MVSDNPYIRRQQKHPIGKSGRASEMRLTKNLNGKGRPASGAMTGAKGDIALENFLLEAKSTTVGSLSLKLDWLAKIGREARSEGKTPALAISFVRPNGSAVLDGEWALIPMHRFKEKFL